MLLFHKNGYSLDYFSDLEVLMVSKMITSLSRRPSRQTCGAIGVMLRGPAIMNCSGVMEKLEAPFLYWSCPGENTFWITPPGVTRENLWIAAGGKRFEHMLASLDRMNPSSRHIFLESPGKIVEVLERMRICFERKTNADKRRLPLLTEELIYVIGETFAQDRTDKRMQAVVQKAARAMSDSPGSVFDIDSIAREAEVSTDYFRHVFQQNIGTSVHDFLLTQRYALAVRMLRETNQSIGMISEACGFPQQRLFTRFFKTRSGVSPREFRKNIY